MATRVSKAKGFRGLAVEILLKGLVVKIHSKGSITIQARIDKATNKTINKATSINKDTNNSNRIMVSTLTQKLKMEKSTIRLLAVLKKISRTSLGKFKTNLRKTTISSIQGLKTSGTKNLRVIKTIKNNSSNNTESFRIKNKERNSFIMINNKIKISRLLSKNGLKRITLMIK